MKRTSRAFIGLILVGIILMATGCTQSITEAMNGQTVKVKVGEPFDIKLRGNPTTGYGWQIADFDTGVVRQDKEAAYKADSLLTGAGGTYTYQFKVTGAGTTRLNFNYLRPWEKDVPPYKTFTITIEVQ